MATERAVTISFLTFAFARLWHVFNMRDPGSNLVRNTVTMNPYVWGALAIGVALLAAALYVPLLSQVLRTVEPGATGWLLIAIGSLVPLPIGQLMKIERVRSIMPRRLIPQPTG
jgi:P-type Ca2+ transporter type 2C